MNLWLVRHAQPLIDAGVCYGASDILADENATLQVARRLAGELPHGLRLITSPLQRCARLAAALQALRPDITFQTDRRLAEMNFGRWELHRWVDIPAADITEWTDNFGTCRFGGAESVQELMDRVTTLWDETSAAPTDAVWITHAGVIRAAMLLSQGVRQVAQANQWPRATVTFGEVLTVASRN